MTMASSWLIFSLLFIGLRAADGFLNYDVDFCVFNSSRPDDIEYIYSKFYNKVEFTRFSSKVNRYVGYTEYGIYQANHFNNDPEEISRRSQEKERVCQYSVDLYFSTILDKSVRPKVSLQAVTLSDGRHPNMLVCGVYDFYPRPISVSWLRDGHKVTSDVTSTDELADADWYYQLQSHLEYTPRSGESISCVVEHISLREPLVTTWDPAIPESERNKIVIGASGLTLGLTLSLAGFIYYKKKAGGRTLVPTETSWT
ncbi:H-2 class II histocompatibility antigen, E-S beta chain-like [Brachionichthys hirsutus]|uniref:H-2 class II histocompatibility antigen, E-S beta chain-like n=1 Tax=Brachionichthys hirsutus TaxID=412623 RepID=UPI003604E106